MLPGLALVFGVAAVARLVQVSGILPNQIGDVLLAIVIGLLINNLLGTPVACRSGAKYAVERILRLAIILLGATLNFVTVIRVGVSALAIIVICIVLALLVASYLGRLARISPRLAILLSVGTAICGNSAIMATAPVIEAKEEEVSFAVATITFFGMLSVFFYPVIGHLLNLPQELFGAWAGVAVNDTSQVVATAFAFGPVAGDMATIIKLTRNSLMVVVILVMGIMYMRSARSEDQRTGLTSRIKLGKVFPLFVLGFLVMALLNTAGLFQLIDATSSLPIKSSAALLGDVAKFLIVVALAGVGLGTNLRQMLRMGLRPLYVGFGVSLVVAVVGLVLVLVLRIPS